VRARQVARGGLKSARHHSVPFVLSEDERSEAESKDEIVWFSTRKRDFFVDGDFGALVCAVRDANDIEPKFSRRERRRRSARV
jgi:hypothetical protein